MRYLSRFAMRIFFATAIASSPAARTAAFVPTISNIGTRQLKLHRVNQALYMTDLTYGLRKATFGIEDKNVLKDLSTEGDNVIFVDVRNPGEIEQSQCCRPFVQGKYLLEDCDDEQVCKDLPDKDAHFIVFCAKGGRASKACQKLRELGYDKVYNAGGLNDLDFLE